MENEEIKDIQSVGNPGKTENTGAEPAQEQQPEQESVKQPAIAESVDVTNVEATEEVHAVDGFQKRINKVTADKYAEKNRADALEAELKKLREERGTGILDTKTGPPTLEQFDYDEQLYTDALVDFKVKRHLSEFQKRQQTQQQTQQQQEQARGFAQKIAQANIPDYADVIDSLARSVVLAPDVISAIQQIDNGPQVAYYLGKNLDVADKVAAGGIAAAIELGRISAKLSAETATPRKPTNAPPPIQPISGAGALNKTVFEMSMEEIFKLDD